LIDALVNPEERGHIARVALGNAQADAICISPLVDLECMVRPLGSGDRRAIAATRDLLARFRQLEISARCFQLAAHLRALHRLKMADALHVATASLGGCDQIWTSDRALLTAVSGFAVEPQDGR
jgi:predicted nucleic acid-binding protein